jgi:nicotinamidase-related amidase
MDRAAAEFGRFSRADIEEMVGYRMGSSNRVGFGERLALLIVDMTRDVVKRHPDVKTAALNTVPLLARARESGIPVLFTRGGRHYHSVSFAPLTDAEKGIYAIKAAPHYKGNPLKLEDFEIADEIAPRQGEVVITKHRSSAFFGTFLESLLNWHRVDTLVIAGMSSTGCLKGTVQDAFFYNYRVILPEECIAAGSGPSSYHYISLLEMDKSRGDVMPLPVVLEFLSGLAGDRKTAFSA